MKQKKIGTSIHLLNYFYEKARLKNIILIGVLFFVGYSSFAQEYNTSKINTFQRGEKLTFKLYYKSAVTGNVSAGELVSEIKPYRVLMANQPSYHIVMDGKTKGAFNWFFKIRDHFESYLDEYYLRPLFFKKRIIEGDYETQRDVYFNQEEGIISYHNLTNGRKGVVETDLEVQDLVSSLYNIRNWDFSNASTGSKYYLNIFLDDSVHQIQFEYMGLYNVKTGLGKMECLKFKPKMLTGGVFADESPMSVYVSNDQNHLPILVVSKVMVGSVRMELKEYEGLKYSLVFD